MGMLESLAFMPVVYALEIKHKIVNIYMMTRNLQFAHVDVEIKEFSFAQNMEQVMTQLIDNLSKIFITIAHEMGPCTYACAKSLQGASILTQSLKIRGNVRQYMPIAGIYMPVLLKDIALIWKV